MTNAVEIFFDKVAGWSKWHSRAMAETQVGSVEGWGVDFSKVKVVELRNKCTKRGLNIKGVKSVLVERIDEAVHKEATEKIGWEMEDDDEEYHDFFAETRWGVTLSASASSSCYRASSGMRSPPTSASTLMREAGNITVGFFWWREIRARRHSVWRILRDICCLPLLRFLIRFSLRSALPQVLHQPTLLARFRRQFEFPESRAD